MMLYTEEYLGNTYHTCNFELTKAGNIFASLLSYGGINSDHLGRNGCFIIVLIKMYNIFWTYNI